MSNTCKEGGDIALGNEQQVTGYVQFAAITPVDTFALEME